MAHEVATTQDGRDAFFEVGMIPTAWHRLGTHLIEAPTLEEAVTVAGLNYPVEKRPAHIRKLTPEGDEYFIESKKAFITWRPDTNTELGSVSARYQVVQNIDAWRVLEPLLDQGLCKLETGGVLRDGADAWLLVRWNVEDFGPVVKEVFADEIIPFGLLANNHSGRRGILLQLTPIRVVCANTLSFAEDGNGDKVVVPHVGDAEAKLTDAAQHLFGAMIERYERVARAYKVLKGEFMDTALFRELVLDVAAPHPFDNPKFNPEAKLAHVVVKRAEERRDTIMDAWHNGAGHVGDSSMWEAYNAVVEIVDHRTDLFPTRGGSWRTASLLDGKLRKTKDAVYNGLMEYATRS